MMLPSTSLKESEGIIGEEKEEKEVNDNVASRDEFSSPACKSSSDTPSSPRFKIKSWSAVALWAWNIAVENCAICRNHIMDPCIECQAVQGRSRGESCSIAWGVCSHAFHSHCISRWLAARQVCPLDNKPWQYQSKD